MLGVALCQRGRVCCVRQNVDGTSAVRTVLVRLEPAALRHCGDSGHDPFRNDSRNDHCAAVIEDTHFVTVSDAARFSIRWIDPETGHFHFVLPFVVVVHGMRTSSGMPADQLERIFLFQRILRSFRTGEIA